MTCFHPLIGFKALAPDPETGKRGIVFNPVKALIEGGGFRLPCGQCKGCRIDKAAQWALRCGHEAQMHDRNCFLTLTYADEHVPQDYSVQKREWQLFMKRARNEYGSGVRFFGCGEYGDQTGRPHYHGLLFGHDFEDKKVWTKRNGHDVYRSDALEKLWPYGNSELGSVTPQSAGYCARYCLKKQTGKGADDHYFRVSPIDGLEHRVEPEFALMSRRPGLGTAWFEKFRTDAFPSDFLIVDGRKVKPPMFYFRKLAKEAGTPAERAGRILRDAASGADTRIKRTRKRFAVQPAQRANGTKERLAVREEVFAERTERLIRPLD